MSRIERSDISGGIMSISQSLTGLGGGRIKVSALSYDTDRALLQQGLFARVLITVPHYNANGDTVAGSEHTHSYALTRNELEDIRYTISRFLEG